MGGIGDGIRRSLSATAFGLGIGDGIPYSAIGLGDDVRPPANGEGLR